MTSTDAHGPRTPAATAPAPDATTGTPEPGTAAEGVLRGTPVVPGVAVGPVVRPAPRPALPQVPADGGAGVVPEDERDAELERARAAAEALAQRLSARAGTAEGDAAAVLRATAQLAADRGLLGEVRKRTRTGATADVAVTGAAEKFAQMFAAMGGLMADRVTDLHDVRDRVVAALTGQAEPGVPVPEAASVLVAEDLAPADTADLDPARVVALVTRGGGPTSHTAIIARQLGIPCVVATAGAEELRVGEVVLVDGTTGAVERDPDAAAARSRVAADRAAREAAAGWRGPGRLADGTAVAVLANVADGAAARVAAEGPAEGVGLFRTELCFLGTAVEPDVEAQAAVYAEVLRPFAERARAAGGAGDPTPAGGAGDRSDVKVVLRTLDAGSDKPIAYATPEHEENPALGVRGLRVVRRDAGLLDRQLDAVALAAGRTGLRPWVMAPMVATEAEGREFAAAVRARGLVPGVMVEVPSVALLAARLLQHVDFLSIGTNDLTQYTMAADRLSSDLADLNDPWQPAVLALVAMTAVAGQRAGKPVGVCGEAAADPLLACVLVGLGVTSLSAAAAAVPAVGARLATVTLEQCRAAAAAAMAAEDPAAGRAAALAALS
ncbi:putative PEP-binding protein [Pseudokineococcus basanitobsidens]|uniref:Phosphoenolpyruvate-protein phosphotransferase n=1 Tax=Pseudokineococcus basanitobsidens TaxID=1926649 RepID=A0ABU8RKR5_9ACTN